LVALGEFGEAEALLLEDLEDIQADDDRAWAVGVGVRLSRLHLASGPIAEAVADAESALALADEIGARLFVPLARTNLALAAMHRGDLDVAARQLERCLDEPGVLGGRGTAPGMCVIRKGLQQGANKRATAVADAAVHLSANNTGFPSVVAIADHARGLLDQDAGALLQAFSDHAHPWARASAAEDASAVLVADGQIIPGLNLLESAIALYEQAGAEQDAQRARRRSRRLRVRTPPTPPPHGVSDWSSLTDTEHRVATLVASGLTKAQIGERMYRSRHAVDFHLGQIFRKLGVNTRHQLAGSPSGSGRRGQSSEPQPTTEILSVRAE
jgi:DNA-binding CsgD family transcriptional regulator